MRKALGVLILFCAIGLFSGCDLVNPKPQPRPVSPKPPVSKIPDIGSDAPLYDLDKNLTLTDLKMVKSEARRLSGDLRPFWIVSGRIENNTVLPVKNIHLRVTLRYRGTATDVDSADVILKDEIPGGTTLSFMQAIQILPPDNPWEWDCTASEATTLYVP